ncbi:hypothetical protein GQ44DRAFT_763524 [Phaeosphaeriaceae sp. PMI808]|nr:hypothetical protein GQ44DRAFT_763524 [Phaeosphaeriaceae sp. PMI808]
MDTNLESKMRDRRQADSSFEDEHGTRDAWFESIETVITKALVKPDEDQPLKLRFVKNRRDPKKPYDFELTPLKEVPPGTKYITVSYCWEQPVSAEVIPEYRILVDGTYRAIRCPRIVFHRSVRFARQKQCDLIWIDQECIKQKDTVNYEEDLEYHLQVMDRVYGESICTVAPLSTMVFLEGEVVERLLDWPKNEAATGSWSSLFGRLRMDPWFLRAWTMNERFCAREVYILLKTNWRPPSEGRHSEYEKLEDDLLITLANAKSPSGNTLSRMNHLLGDKALRDHARKIITGEIRDTEEWNVLYKFQMAMTMCGCRILSDKVAVFGNIFKLPWRLNSNRLNDSRFYFPTCVLALMLVNQFPDSEDRQRLYKDDKSVLQYWFSWGGEDGFEWIRKWIELSGQSNTTTEELAILHDDSGSSNMEG